MNKAQHKSKTNWFGVGLMLFGGIQQLAPQLQAELSPSAYNWVMFGVGLAVIGLRQITKGPVGE